MYRIRVNLIWNTHSTSSIRIDKINFLKTKNAIKFPTPDRFPITKKNRCPHHLFILSHIPTLTLTNFSLFALVIFVDFKFILSVSNSRKKCTFNSCSRFWSFCSYTRKMLGHSNRFTVFTGTVQSIFT